MCIQLSSDCGLLYLLLARFFENHSKRAMLHVFVFFSRHSPSNHLFVTRAVPVPDETVRLIHSAAFNRVSQTFFKADSVLTSKSSKTSCNLVLESSELFFSSYSFVFSLFHLTAVEPSLCVLRSPNVVYEILFRKLCYKISTFKQEILMCGRSDLSRFSPTWASFCPKSWYGSRPDSYFLATLFR